MNTQKDNAFKYAIKQALPIEEEYEDADTSAVKNTAENRQNFKRLLTDIEKGTVKHLLVYKRDRLARNSIEYMEIYELFKKHKINVHFTSDNEYPMNYSHMGEFVELLMSGLVEHEIVQMKERIAETWFTKFENGESYGNLPYGYVLNKEENKIELISEELENVEKIFDMILSEKFISLNELQKKLIEEKVKWRHRDWKVADIKQVISGTIYLGYRFKHFKGFPEPAKQETPFTKIKSITKKMWERANHLLSQMEKPRGKNEKLHFLFLLEGLLYCEACGEVMKGESRIQQRQPAGKYVCTCRTRGVLKEVLEDIVMKKGFEFFNLIVKENYDEVIYRYTRSQIDLIEKRIKGLTDQQEASDKRLFQTTEKWMDENKVAKKRELKKELLDIKTNRDQLIKEIQQFEEEINQQEELAERILRYYQYTKETKIDGYILTEQDKKEWLHDIVRDVRLDEMGLHITFKHPFESVKEVFVVEAESYLKKG